METNTQHITTDTLIIGAGPAGLSCAMELSKKKKDFIVIEKDTLVGGLSKTYSFTEPDGLTFYTDNGPHRFFSKNPYLYEFIEDIVGEEWIAVERYTRQYIDGLFYDYPVNALQALKNLGLINACLMLLDYVYAKIVFGVFKKPIKTFEDYAIASFGKRLALFNIINYTEKIWGIDAQEIHPDWAIQRIKGLNVTTVIRNAIQSLFKKKGADTPKSLVDVFYYPSSGTGLIYNKIVERITSQGYSVMTGIRVTNIERVGSLWRVRATTPEAVELVIEASHLVESIPITEFIRLLSPQVPAEVSNAGSKLRHRSQIYVFLTLNIPSITKDQWIYFPSKHTPIARISEMKNFSSRMSPEGKTSLFVEFFCFEGDDMWKKTDDELIDLCIAELEKSALIHKKDLRHGYVIKQKNVYPVYDLTYQEHVSVLKKYLDQFSNLFYIGRPGRFRYNNQDHSLEMGMLAAKSIIDGVHYDIESIGDEKEYYEKGTTPTGTSTH